MQTERVDVASLVLDPVNARKHEQKNLEAIKGSLARFGQQKPIVVGAKNVVIAGNGTLSAARELGWKEIEIVRTDLTGVDATAFALADNRTSELADWDPGALGDTLRALRDADFDLDAIGFDARDLDNMIPDFEPGSEGDQGKLDEKSKVQCPECGHEFAP